MLNILKFELKRSFANRNFVIVIVIGLIITISHVMLSVIPSVSTLDNYLLGKGEYPISVFNKWIFGEGHSIQPTLYNLLIPILATIPFVDSAFMDNKSGYTKNLFVKTKKRQYYIAKLLSTYLSAGIAVIIPVLVNLILTAVYLPSLIPEASAMTFSLNESCMLSDIFYTHPYLYVTLYMVIIFLYAGLFALLGLVAAFFVDNRLFVLLFPFMSYVLADLVLSYFDLHKFSPKLFLRPDQPAAADIKIVIIEYCALLVILVCLYMREGEKNEAI